MTRNKMFNGYLSRKLDNSYLEIDEQGIDFLWQQNIDDMIECERVTREIRTGTSNCNSMNDFGRQVIYDDFKTGGFTMVYPHGTVIRQAERNHFYRGENQIYHESIPTILRELEKISSDEDKHIYTMITEMRIAKFANFLKQFKHVQNWSQQNGDVLYEALAQHYGFKTSWLDITNDFGVAMFFATCFYNTETHKWQPLTKEQTEINEETKYGVIFHIPNWRLQIKNIIAVAGDKKMQETNNLILPIGFQPFMRCQQQYSYGINMQYKYPLQVDHDFEKLKFRHSESLSQRIFSLMKQGLTVFPNEGLNKVSKHIEAIKNSTAFSNKEIEMAYSKTHFFIDKHDCKQKIVNSNILDKKITIGNESSANYLEQEVIQDIDSVYEKRPLLGISSRLMYLSNQKS